MQRDVLTADLLIAEGGEHESATERARRRALLVVIGALPEGFRVERVQGRGEPGRDPGAELTLIDERRRPQRVVGRVDRRLIGDQRVSWTAARLTTPETAEAFAVLLRYAATDAEGRDGR